MTSDNKCGGQPSVVFVCTSNRCRSVAAEALWRKRVQDSCPNADEWTISSAGTWADEGKPPIYRMAQLLHEHGIDVSAMSSRRINRDIITAHKLVLVMEQGHKEALNLEFPEFSDRIFMLSEMTGVKTAVEDPQELTPEAIDDCVEEINAWLTMGEKRIIELSDGK